MTARCQKRRRTRIAKGGQVFNEQAILGKPEWPARFCFSLSRARCGILHAASLNRDPGFF
jgi:hypothetical protein